MDSGMYNSRYYHVDEQLIFGENLLKVRSVSTRLNWSTVYDENETENAIKFFYYGNDPLLDNTKIYSLPGAEKIASFHFQWRVTTERVPTHPQLADLYCHSVKSRIERLMYLNKLTSNLFVKMRSGLEVSSHWIPFDVSVEEIENMLNAPLGDGFKSHGSVFGDIFFVFSLNLVRNEHTLPVRYVLALMAITSRNRDPQILLNMINEYWGYPCSTCLWKNVLTAKRVCSYPYRFWESYTKCLSFTNLNLSMMFLNHGENFRVGGLVLWEEGHCKIFATDRIYHVVNCTWTFPNNTGSCEIPSLHAAAITGLMHLVYSTVRCWIMRGGVNGLVRTRDVIGSANADILLSHVRSTYRTAHPTLKRILSHIIFFCLTYGLPSPLVKAMNVIISDDLAHDWVMCMYQNPLSISEQSLVDSFCDVNYTGLLSLGVFDPNIVYN